MNKIYNNLNVDNLMKTDWFNQFNKEQQEEIRLGLEKNIDVSIYAKPDFYAWQMKQIRLGLEEKLNVSSYAKKIFTAEKMLNERLKLKESEIIVPFERRNYLISDLKKGLG